MTRTKPPRVFRIAAALLLAAVVFGGWWQHQPVGTTGRAFLGLISRACPAATRPGKHPSVHDTARALDRWAYANRCFPTKVVAIWRSLDMRGQASLIGLYMERTRFTGIEARVLSDGSRGDPLVAMIGRA